MGFLSNLILRLLVHTLLVIEMKPLAFQRYPFEGVLYKELYPDSNYIKFSKTQRNEWRNLTNLSKTYGLDKKGIFCSLHHHSGWIAYPEANYSTDSFGSNEVWLIIGKLCVETSQIESIQAILPLRRRATPTLVVFKEPNFLGFAHALDLQSIELGHTRLPGTIGSLILYGSKSWTLRALDGKSVCVYAAQHLVNGKGEFFCPLRNLQEEWNVTGKVRITRGCFKDAGESEKIEMRRCYGEGDHVIWTQRGSSACKEGLSPYESQVIDDLAFIKYIWKRRRHLKSGGFLGDVLRDGRVKVPEGIQGYRDVLSLVFDKVGEMCGEVSQEFLVTLKEVLFLRVLTFDGTVQKDFHVEGEALRNATGWLSSCGEARRNGSGNGSVSDVVDPVQFLLMNETSGESNEIEDIQVIKSCESGEKTCGWKSLVLNEDNSTELPFVTTALKQMLNAVLFKCVGSPYQSEFEEFLDSRIYLPVVKHFQHSKAHLYAFNGLGVPKEMQGLNKCTCIT